MKYEPTIGTVARIAAAAIVCVLGLRTCPATADPIVVSTESPPLPVAISPYDRHLRYNGRFDVSDPNGPKCQWSACAVRIVFRGSAANIVLNEQGSGDEYEVVVDGHAAEVLVPANGTHMYSLSAPPNIKPAAHSIDIVKRTEAFVGTGQILGFQLSGGHILQAPAFTRWIEVIGDSISCGYGDEGKNQNEHFSTTTENAYLTYGAVAARAFGAGYTCVAWSGKKMWPDNTIPEIYDRTLPTDASSRWDYSNDISDAVVINLGTNDWRDAAPDEKGWTSAYEAFLRHIRANYPKAVIYCATSPMMYGDQIPQQLKYLQEIVAFENTSGDPSIKLLVFAPQDIANGLGADWHPNIKTHQIMATALINALERDLGWKTIEP
jgi:lysophospholipase L1-like esterase